MPEIDLQGHAALVTGSTQGIGRAIALALAGAGAKLVLHGLENDAEAQATIEACRGLGAEPKLVCCDLAQSPSIATGQLWRQAVRIHPQLNLLVNNAGTFCDRPFLEMDFETFDRTMQLNVYAYYFLAQAAARHWVEHQIRGRMLFTGSINGRLAEPDHTAYDTSKGAVEMMVKSLCVALGPHGIRVNGLAPGLVQSPLTNQALRDPDFRHWMELHTPNQEVPPAEVCGEAAVFLLSSAARHIHGHMLMVDGGMSAWQQPDRPTTPTARAPLQPPGD